MGSAGLPLPMACRIPQSKPCSRIANISIGSPPGAAACSTMHIVSAYFDLGKAVRLKTKIRVRSLRLYKTDEVIYGSGI